ncbi:MAG: hypothetical protein D6788_10950, partial [Planctomycetota bacterium]
IFVSRRDAKVAVYDAAFVFQHFLAEGVATFVNPTDLAVDAQTGEIYVLDSSADRYYVFQADETLARIVGMRGGLPGQFKYPTSIAVDPARDRVIVTDMDNFRVQIFTRAGLFERSFGYRIKFLPGGVQEGWFPRSAGAAVDAQGRIYITDALMSTLRLFSTTGGELSKLADYGTAPGMLRTPGDVALDAAGNVYVVNSAAGTVEVFAPVATVAAAGEGIVYKGTNACAYDRLRASTATVPKRGFHSRFRDRAGQDAGSSEGSVTAQPPPGWEPPHMFDDVSCGRCHDVDAQPGGHLGTVEGQLNLCLSCHNGAGPAVADLFNPADLADPFGTNPAAPDGTGRSHAWGVPAVNAQADSIGPVAGGEMERHLDNGSIKCATCHNQHNNEAGVPFLRVSNDGDAMCKECHQPRDRGPGEGGSHPVGFAYPAGQGEFPPLGPGDPLSLADGNVECTTCHDVHNADSGGANQGAGDGMLLRSANDETLCQRCHTDHMIHSPAGDWQPTCRDCHDVHDPSNGNLSLVADTIFNRTLGVDKPVVFTARSGPNSFDDGDPSANDGICQVCHTATAYHRHDGTGVPHNDGVDCTSCHPHSNGFIPVGGASCIGCHSNPQDNGDGVPPGGRRAILGEFPQGDAHAHYGADLDDADCLVCHSMSTHQDGYVELIDPDDGSIYRFQRPDDLTNDPDVSDFCLGCHDGDGAMRLGNPMDPFGNGNAPPDVALRFAGTLQWNEQYGDSCFGTEGTLRAVNSHHDISDADQAFSGARIECLHCHNAHSASASQPIIDPYDVTHLWTGNTSAFCLTCHAGGNGPTDPLFPPGVVGPSVPLRGIESCDYQDPMWYVDYTWTHSAHGPDSKRGWQGYSGAPSAVVGCTVCHDPHGSYTDTNPAGNPYMIRDVVDGTPFVDDGTRTGGFNGPPWDTFGTKRTVRIGISGLTVDWGGSQGLCNVCHADWLAAYDFHSFCGACQICHAHGAAFGETDWVDGNDTPCPTPATAGVVASGTEESFPRKSGARSDEKGNRPLKPLHHLGGERSIGDRLPR